MSSQMSDTRSQLTPECSCKASSWPEVRPLPSRLYDRFRTELARLPVFELPASPCDYLRPEASAASEFIGVMDGERFYVNTEGYDYARYAAALPVDLPAYLEARLAGLLGVPTLATRNSDSLDFHDLAVWQIRAALVEAYRSGRED